MGTALEIKKVSKVFGTRKALNKVSFELPEGAFLSIFGPNGAGKSTLARILSTLSRPTAGRVQVLGEDALEHPERVRAQVGVISHNSMLYRDMTAEENLSLVARLYGIEDASDRVRTLLKDVELDHRRLDVVRTFSRGMMQRLSIARALINDPALVILDEPYSGLDPHAVEIFDTLIERVKEGRTFIMVSHDLAKGFDMCTHALVLANGRVVTFDERENLAFDSFKRLYLETVGMGVA
jgi:heme exporter protein A